MAELAAPKLREGTSGHWYTPDGEPAYEVCKRDGTGKRPTTLRDAKTLGLLPGVTTVLNALDRPQLTLWKQKQAILATRAVEMAKGEDVDAWMDRVLAKAAEPVAEAADLGSRIHGAIETACAGGHWDTEALGPYVNPILNWILARLAAGGRIIAQEAIVVNRTEGYAGRLDIAIQMPDRLIWFIDWKSRKTRPGDSDRVAFTPYNTQRLQLGAYSAIWAVEKGLGWPLVRCANVMTSSTEPGRFAVVEHDNPEASFEAFRALMAIWRWNKAYDPRKHERRA